MGAGKPTLTLRTVLGTVNCDASNRFPKAAWEKGNSGFNVEDIENGTRRLGVQAPADRSSIRARAWFTRMMDQK